ncbi:DUF2256 domain-containing protein [Rheinheimera sp. YQF-2]|uniref:DUF2256 domain-containing protein n=1 Tax=Rheinheimera lutimaris TaxID=2740584 RepID=A0A7Y5AMP2_9GAMM|nr:DUF2256 domain-containing protein [Rheinheimera lutimaris]NRQ41167.1 DUF2256 domain-containing protein [Rheinheimera lutimaris]
MPHKKLLLAQKRCPVCGLMFNWRKKWQLNWHTVIYCSERCRRNKTSDKNENR